jgi:hypothetical protein
LFTYFRFITRTTTGYGDITPVHPVARTLTMCEALVGVRMLKEVRIESGKQVKALSQQTDLAYQRYYGGVTPYLEVLDSDRQLFESELKLTQDRANELLAVIALYRALGGGWQIGKPAKSQNQNTAGMNKDAVK